MKFFVDTADTAEIKSLAASGLLDGVTTNPSLMAKTGQEVPGRAGRHLRRTCPARSAPRSPPPSSTA